jgi:hypothetical protein
MLEVCFVGKNVPPRTDKGIPNMSLAVLRQLKQTLLA